MRGRGLIVGAWMLGCAEVPPSPAGVPEPSAQTVTNAVDDAGAARCRLPVATLAGPLLEPFRDDVELARYLEAATASCTVRNHAVRLAEGASASDDPAPEHAPAPADGAQGPGDAAADAEPAAVVLDRSGWLSVVDVSAPGAPRQIGTAPGGGLSGFVTLPAGRPLRAGDFVYTFAQIHVPEPSGPQRTGAPQASSPLAGAPAPQPRSLALEISTRVVRADGLALVDRSYFELGWRSSAAALPVRAVDGALVLGFSIAPSGERVRNEVAGYSYLPLAMPRRLRYDTATGRFAPIGPLLSAGDVYRPLPLADDGTIGARTLTFNTLMRCKPEPSGALACTAKAHLGQVSNHLLTSPTRMYTEGYGRVYAWNIADGTLTVHRIEGSPSHKRTALELDEALHVPLYENAFKLESRETVSMASLPLSAFDKRGAQPGSARLLMRAATRPGRMRAHGFVGATYAASLTGYSGDPAAETTLLLYDVRAGAAPQILHDEREYVSFSPLGPDRALLVSRPYRLPAARDARLEVWTLDAAPQLRSAHVLTESWPGWLQAYQGRPDGSGLFAVAADTRVEDPFGIGPSRLGWFDVSKDHQLTPIGWVEDHACSDASHCAGWSRGMFVGDRIFAASREVLQELAVDTSVRRVGAPARLTPP